MDGKNSLRLKLPYKNTTPSVSIGGKEISINEDVYIIAEAGVNHAGRLEIALKMVEAAKRAAANAIKFQVFCADNLVAGDVKPAEYQAMVGYTDQKSMLRTLELSYKDLTDIFHYCKDVGIEFLATPFSIEDLEFLLELGINAIKIASTSLLNIPLLERAIATGLPIIASSGTCSEEEIDYVMGLLAEKSALERTILLHCISSYPTPLESANLEVIKTFIRKYPVPVGYSDHTTDTITGALAVCCGASILEKHFTIDKTLPGPDQAISLDENDLREYIRLARLAKKAMGSPRRKPTPQELEVKRLARMSIVSKVDIPKGSTITEDMLTTKRPGDGIEPRKLPELIGSIAEVDIPADTLIQWYMLRPAPRSENNSDTNLSPRDNNSGSLQR